MNPSLQVLLSSAAQSTDDTHLDKKAANKDIILKLSWLHLLLLPSHSSLKELVKAEQTGEKAESMGTEDDVPQNVVWPCKQGGRSARCCVHQALGTASAGYLN